MLRWFGKKVRLPVANPRQSTFTVVPRRVLRDPVQFISLADSQIARIYLALQHLQTQNPESKVTAVSGKTAIQVKEDLFEVAVDLNMQVITMLIPRLGTFRYIYDEENSRWVGENDGHNLEELLTRELMRVSQGYLQL